MTVSDEDTTHSDNAAPPSVDHADQCIWCDLPVRPRADRSPQYCCYGCRLAHTLAEEKGDTGQLRWTVIRLGLAIFFTMNLMAFTMAMWSMDVYDVEPDPFQQSLFEVFRWLSMTLAIPVLLLLGLPMVTSAFQGRPTNTFFADALIVLGVTAAGLTSAVNVVGGDGPIYFEVGAMVLVMVTLGRWLEAEGKLKATATLDEFARLLPENVHRVQRPEQSTEADRLVPSEEIQPGDLIRVRSGERFPVDGAVVAGEASVDEQIFTGESSPIFRGHGDAVLAGTINLDGLLVIESASTFRGGSFGKLVKLLRQARSQQGRYQRIAESIAQYFLPAVIVIAVATFGWHAQESVSIAIHNSLSVLLIACPCALGLATPLAIWTAFSKAVQHQVLFRNGEAIERLAGISNVCLDKTGTLTTGQPTVSRFRCFGDDEPTTRALCLELARTSRHPISVALAEHLASDVDNRSLVDHDSLFRHCRSNSGKGIEATLHDGQIVRLGQPAYVAEPAAFAKLPLDGLAGSTESLVACSVDGIVKAVATVEESHRSDIAATLREFRRIGISPWLLTGDREKRAGAFVEALAKEGSASSEDTLFRGVYSGLLPAEKMRRLHTIRNQNGATAMLGDGINDAPVLAAADVGIAMGCGSDIARDSASVCLLGDQLNRVPWAVRLARQTRRTIRQNLFWAFSYNTVGIILAARGVLNPAMSAALMIASSLLVISNSLRLLAFAGPAIATRDSHHSPDPNCDTASHSSEEWLAPDDGIEPGITPKSTPKADERGFGRVGAGNAL